MATAPIITFPNRATPGWERYHNAHWDWYHQNHVGPRPANRKKFWKDIIRPNWDANHIGTNARAEIRAIYNHPNYVAPTAQDPPIAIQPALPANGWSWPPEIPFPPGAFRPIWLQLPNNQTLLAAQTAAVQQAAADVARAVVDAERAAAGAERAEADAQRAEADAERAEVADAERAAALAAANAALEDYIQSDASRRSAFPDLKLKEAGDDLVPEIRCRSVLKSVAEDKPDLFGITPAPDHAGFSTPDGPWTCPGSTDPTSTAQWIPKRELGSGVTASAILWLKKDGDSIIDGVVTKDVDLARYWTNRTYWAEDDRKTPMEAAVHAAINLELSPFVAGFRGYRLHRGIQVVRIATDFAYMGDLTGLLANFCYDPWAMDANKWKPEPASVQTVTTAVAPAEVHDEASRAVHRIMFCSEESAPSRPSKPGRGDTQKETQTPLPEHFVWLLFKALVEATVHMHKANAVHLDLHAGNILIAEDHDGAMGGYGIKPLIVDFGYALPVRSDRFNNPEDYRLPGKPQTWAPEQIITYPRLVDPPEGAPAIGKHTSVFHLGILIHFILNGGVSPNWDELQSTFDYRENENPQFKPESLYKYRDLLYKEGAHPELLSEDQYLDQVLMHCHNTENGSASYYHTQLAPFLPLIKSCLSFEPKDRIELENLLAMIKIELERFEVGNDEVSFFQDRLPKRRRSEAFGDESEDDDGSMRRRRRLDQQ